MNSRPLVAVPCDGEEIDVLGLVPESDQTILGTMAPRIPCQSQSPQQMARDVKEFPSL